MTYHAPRAAVENHYHVQELIDAQERRAADRTYHQDRIRQRDERIKDIQDAKIKDIKGFWCPICSTDFVSESIKEVEMDWTNSAQSIAFYRSKCPKGHWCIRHITDIIKDGYWTRSRFVVLDRGRHYTDALQPHETGFNTLYKKI